MRKSRYLPGPLMTPKNSNEAQKGYSPPHKRWDERCSTCNGTGYIRNLRGAKEPCPRCTQE